MSPVEINSLPDLCLLAIFDNLTLQKLLPLSRVCPRWNNMIKESACCRRRSLTLFIGNRKNSAELVKESHFVKQVKSPQIFNSLSCEIMLRKNADWMVETLPNVKYLVISGYAINSATMNHINHLLFQWKLKLVSVRFHLRFDASYTDIEDLKIIRNTHQAFQQLNRMPKLRNLLFESPRRFAYNHREILYFPVIAQLDEFYFHTLDSLNFVYGSLKMYGQTNDRLKKICFGDTGRFDQRLLTRFLAFEPEFASRFVQIDLHYTPGLATYEFNQFCRHFSGLQMLTLALDDLQLSALTNSLVHLKQLNTLGLIIDFSRELRSLSLEDSESPNEFSPLPSVKTILLYIRTVSHLDLKSTHLGLIFPEIEMVKVEGFLEHCQVCANVEKSEDKEKQCKKRMFSSFGQCKKLKMIELFE